MNALDAVVVVASLAAALGGWRFGFIARLLAWAGVAAGLMIGIRFVPGVVTAFGGTAADDRVTVALLFLVLVATLGQGVGLAVGALVHRLRPDVRGLPVWDRAAGAAIGVVGVLTLLWMTIPSLATAEGWPARAARGSTIVAAISDVAPKQPSRFSAWGRAISQAPYPSALGPLDTPPDPGTPPKKVLSPTIDSRVRKSVVKVWGLACTQIQEGSGWVAAPGLIVTNAHVVAGETETHVEDQDHTEHTATVVAFDAKRDVAVLSVPGLIAFPLHEASGSVGMTGAVYGHPGGHALRAAPARIGEEIVAVGTDIYRTSDSRRRVYVLAARLEPGDSGAPLVNGNGDVVGVAFAIDPAHRGTAYAVTDDEVTPVLNAVRQRPVSTGHCLV
ncbi:MAG: Trypsin-like peptidase domain/Colicin production protein [Actinomycetia bacterium]|nr:Trypsin-like peptidase domain/Colicin production protein [Actinomycetes bacterium]